MRVLFFLLTLIIRSHAQDSIYEPVGHCSLKISYKEFKLCYSPEHKLAKWALHSLKLKHIEGSVSRTNDYRADPRLKDPVTRNDYRSSGYDRGHLVPAADRKNSHESMSETFYMTNMTPQHPSFNRGIWLSLERHLRKLVVKYGDAIIISAPHLHQGLRKFQKGMSLPDEHYKIIFWPTLNKAFAYLIPNESARGRKISDFQVTINSLEELTQLDFFSSLDDRIEEEMEESLEESEEENKAYKKKVKKMNSSLIQFEA